MKKRTERCKCVQIKWHFAFLNNAVLAKEDNDLFERITLEINIFLYLQRKNTRPCATFLQILKSWKSLDTHRMAFIFRVFNFGERGPVCGVREGIGGLGTKTYMQWNHFIFKSKKKKREIYETFKTRISRQVHVCITQEKQHYGFSKVLKKIKRCFNGGAVKHETASHSTPRASHLVSAKTQKKNHLNASACSMHQKSGKLT